jgi:hypothetical protein
MSLYLFRAAGKAFEYLIGRASELDGARMRWPYDTQIDWEVVEQIDGEIVVGGLYCLIECQDESKPLAPLAKRSIGHALATGKDRWSEVSLGIPTTSPRGASW